MNTTILFLGAGQVILTLAVGYIAYLVRRDSKRSSLVTLVTLLSQLREKNSEALTTSYSLMSSEDFSNSFGTTRTASTTAFASVSRYSTT